MITVVEPGKRFQIKDSAGASVDLTFFHKSKEGNYIDGITSEDLLEVLVSRVRHFTVDQGKDSEENLKSLIHLKQALQWMRQRNYKKLKISKQDSK
jgi:carboxypeptidase C (cathepsin A)